MKHLQMDEALEWIVGWIVKNELIVANDSDRWCLIDFGSLRMEKL